MFTFCLVNQTVSGASLGPSQNVAMKLDFSVNLIN